MPWHRLSRTQPHPITSDLAGACGKSVSSFRVLRTLCLQRSRVRHSHGIPGPATTAQCRWKSLWTHMSFVSGLQLSAVAGSRHETDPCGASPGVTPPLSRVLDVKWLLITRPAPGCPAQPPGARRLLAHHRQVRPTAVGGLDVAGSRTQPKSESEHRLNGDRVA